MNDIGQYVNGFIEQIVHRAVETEENFIFEHIEPWCSEVVQRKISKRDLEMALTQYFKRGHWTTKRTNEHDGEWYCDQCGYEPIVFENTPFCAKCGARMVKQDG